MTANETVTTSKENPNTELQPKRITITMESKIKWKTWMPALESLVELEPIKNIATLKDGRSNPRPIVEKQ